MKINSVFFKGIAHIFWDLDHTLWDYSTNSRLTIYELYEKHELHQRIDHGPEIFHAVYSRHNDIAWEQYRNGVIDKDLLRQQRFRDTFLELGTDPQGISEIFEIEFVHICRTKPHLIPGAMDVLNYFDARHFKQHIITNGFKEALDHKIQSSGISHFFTTITNSEDTGYQKPNPEIFSIALETAGALAENSVMIGDNFKADVMGAHNLGIKCVFYDPEKKHLEKLPEGIMTVGSLVEILKIQ